MIALAALSGFVWTGLLLVLGHGLFRSVLWGYVCGGMLTMVIMALRMVICDWHSTRTAPRFGEDRGQQPVQRATTRNVWMMVARSSRRLISRE